MEKLETELVIIGCGTAGLAAGLTALQNGTKKIVLLEKRINYGGNSSMAGGMMFGAESRLQKKEGNVVYRDAIFKATMEFAHFDRINSRLVRALIDKSGETIDWLEGYGIQFELAPDKLHILKGKFKAAIMQYSLVMETLANIILEKGGRILLRTSAKKILRDEKGAISGVVAATRDGEEIQIKCRSVVLTTGGFTGNKELLMKYFGYNNFATEAVPNKGDGIKMAEEAGAYLEEYASLCLHNTHPEYVNLDTLKNQPNHRVLTGPYSIWVNSRGERFFDAGTKDSYAGVVYGGNLLFRQPGKVAYVLLDDKLLQTPMNIGPGPGGEGVPVENLRKLREELHEESKRGSGVCMSDSWEGIARYIGATPATLQATIDQYNSYCDREFDAFYNKEKKYMLPLRSPPYYAVKLQAGLVEAIGPVRINECMEVLDQQQNPIPGFYAAGAITSGWCGHDYHIGGSNLGFGTTGGRIAGESVAKYLAKK